RPPRLRRRKVSARRPPRTDVVHDLLARLRVRHGEVVIANLLPPEQSIRRKQERRSHFTVAAILRRDRTPASEPCPPLRLALDTHASMPLLDIADEVFLRPSP